MSKISSDAPSLRESLTAANEALDAAVELLAAGRIIAGCVFVEPRDVLGLLMRHSAAISLASKTPGNRKDGSSPNNTTGEA